MSAIVIMLLFSIWVQLNISDFPSAEKYVFLHSLAVCRLYPHRCYVCHIHFVYKLYGTSPSNTFVGIVTGWVNVLDV